MPLRTRTGFAAYARLRAEIATDFAGDTPAGRRDDLRRRYAAPLLALPPGTHLKLWLRTGVLRRITPVPGPRDALLLSVYPGGVLLQLLAADTVPVPVYTTFVSWVDLHDGSARFLRPASLAAALRDARAGSLPVRSRDAACP